ncbi:MAG: Rpn family recombination-promoting nuclease/putative transposase [Planctomycetes bacterium]|nr:Rpn family recombination-promoting nuclease/putative transposase [Planctomycetota bacterium]
MGNSDLLALRKKHGLPVQTVIVLLRPAADPGLPDGPVRIPGAAGTEMTFTCVTIRVWRESCERLLNGAIGLAPLAPLAGAPTVEALPRNDERLLERFEAEVPDRTGELMTATAVLMGLKHEKELVDQIVGKVKKMEESSYYQMVIERGMEKGTERGMEKGMEKGQVEGRLTEARRIIVRLGSRTLGAPSDEVRARIEHAADIDRLEALLESLPGATSWNDALTRGGV